MNIMRTGEELLAAVLQELSRLPGARVLTIPGGAREIYDADEDEAGPSKADTYVTYNTLLHVRGVDDTTWMLSLGKEFSALGQPTGGGCLAIFDLAPEPGVSDELVIAYGVRELVNEDAVPGLLYYEASGEITWLDRNDASEECWPFIEILFNDHETQPTSGAYRYHWDALPLIVNGFKAVFAGNAP